MIDLRASQIFSGTNMTIALESEIVSTKYDPLKRICSYTLRRGGEQWTVNVPRDDLDKHKGPTAKQLRRRHVASALMSALQRAPDPHAGTKEDPHKPGTWQTFDQVPSGEWYVNAADGKLYQKP